jgi:type IV pilus assembly protein PilW
MKRKKRRINLQAGFTLIELLIAMLLASIVMAAAYATYLTQQKSYFAQNQVVEMQQNIRAAMLMLSRDIREAGCDPTQVAGAGFVTATAGQLRITRDIAGHAVSPNQEDGDVLDPNEDIVFGFDPTADANADGIPDGAVAVNFCRRDVNGAAPTVFQPIAENIERVEFRYIDENGAFIAAPITAQVNLNSIRAVQVAMLARASQQDPKFSNAATYTAPSGTVWGPFNDGFRRRLSVTTIQSRNKGY